MDFQFSEEDEAFRRDLQEFLAEHLPPWWQGMFVEDPRAMPFTREVCAELAERGWLTMAWPQEHGGQEATPWKQAVLREEMWASDEPRGPQYMNLNYIGPLVMRFGTPEQKRRFLPPMARGEVIWCQGFSEPDAGSDLASLRTRAVVEGGHYIVNGQKIWTSYADSPADWCVLLVRTNPDVPKREGISILLVDMRTPGITVRPIDTMAGPHEFNEVFFDDVRVPTDCLLHQQDRGWEAVVTGLTLERVGIARYARVGRVLEILTALVDRDEGVPALAEDAVVRAQLAELRVRYEAARLLNYRAISLQARGEPPIVEAAVARIHNTQLERDAGHLGLEILGLSGQLTHEDPDSVASGFLWRQWTRNIPTTIAGGTLEVQKNIVARELGLPRAT